MVLEQSVISGTCLHPPILLNAFFLFCHAQEVPLAPRAPRAAATTPTQVRTWFLFLFYIFTDRLILHIIFDFCFCSPFCRCLRRELPSWRLVQQQRCVNCSSICVVNCPPQFNQIYTHSSTFRRFSLPGGRTVPHCTRSHQEMKFKMTHLKSCCCCFFLSHFVLSSPLIIQLIPTPNQIIWMPSCFYI